MKTVFGSKSFTAIFSEYVLLLFFTLMGWLICFEIFFGEREEEISFTSRQISIVILFALSSLVYFYIRPKLYKKYQFWQLKDDFLVRGDPVNLEIYLPSVETVMKGLPKPLPGMQTLLVNAMRLKYGKNNPLSQKYRDTLLLKIGPATYFPLYLNHLGNGDKLMAEVSGYLAEKIVTEPEFTYIERKVITPWKCNKILKL